MKIVLIDAAIGFFQKIAGLYFPNPGLLAIASFIEKHGYNVKIVDMVALNLNLEDISRIIKKEKPDVVGLSGITKNVYICMALAKIVKEVDPKIITVLGGTHFSLVPEESLIVVTRVGLGKVALTKTPLCFSQDSQALIGNSSLLYPEYSLYYLCKAVQIFKFEHRGTTIAGVTKKQLRQLPFPLSPFPEQQEIVEEIERRFSVADEPLHLHVPSLLALRVRKSELPPFAGVHG